ncbi:MAG: hypothetical protein PVI90_17970, partial [Desulfobacteraceae bacterium]
MRMLRFKYYFVVIFMISIIIMIGCGDDDGIIGPTREASTIQVRTDGVNAFWARYVDIFGYPLDQEGLAITFDSPGHPIYQEWGGGVVGWIIRDASATGQMIKSSGVTGNGGCARAIGSRENWIIFKERVVSKIGVFSKPEGAGGMSCASVSIEYRTRGEPRAEVALGDNTSEHFALDSPDNSITGNLTPAEYEALI